MNIDGNKSIRLYSYFQDMIKTIKKIFPQYDIYYEIK